MTRRLILVFILAAVCASSTLAAGPLPVAGAYRLICSTDMTALYFSGKNDYCPVILLPKTKPASLSLNVAEKLGNLHYYALKIDGRSYHLVAARSSLESGAAGFNALYFDADADGTITSTERVPVEVYQTAVDGVTKDSLLLWTARPKVPLAIELPSARADGAGGARRLTFSIELYAHVEEVEVGGKNDRKLLEALEKLLNPSCHARIFQTTWFIGEIAAAGDRVCKAALVDGNQNGLFNEAKEDFLLIDANYDSLFDWAKEKKPLGKTLSGLGADGRKGPLTPAVASWPRRLWLAAKGCAPTQAQLESEEEE